MTQEFTSILLPPARVDFFALDDGTAKTAQALAGDWRFARVGVQITRAGIEAAISHYSTTASPELIVIETNDIGEAFLAQLGQLAGVCAAGTDAVIIGPTNDVHLYRNLVGMGVRDYLVRPVSADELVSVVARSLVEKHGMAGSRLVSVMGSKGGVGATSLAQLLAWSVAENYKQKTVLLDAAGSGGSIGIAFGIEPSATMAEGLRIGAGGSDDDMRRIVQPAGEFLSIMALGGDPLLADVPDADQVEALIKRLMQKNPVVMIDLSGAPPPVQRRLLAMSSHIAVVTSSLVPALRNTRTLLGELKILRGNLKEVDLILNMKGMAGNEEMQSADIKKALEVEPAAIISYLPRIFVAGEAMGKPVGHTKAAQEIVTALDKVAARAAGLAARGGKVEKEEGGGAFAFLKNIGKKG